MKDKWMWMIFAAAYLAAFAANAGYFWWSYPIGAIQTAATVVYVAVCIWLFQRVRKQKKPMRWVRILSGLTAVTGAVGLLIRAGATGLAVLGVLLAGVFVTPLYGLLGWLPDFDVCYAAVIVWGMAWLLAACRRFWKKGTAVR